MKEIERCAARQTINGIVLMETRYESGSQTAQNVGQDIKSSMTEAGREAASKLSAALNTAKTKIQEQTTAGARATDRAIREHPYESIGIAFGIGVLIGVLINR